MTTPVNFELAKLLKEKGFNEEVRDYYEEKDGTFHHSQYFRDNVSINEKHKGFITAPTIAEVIMWLYEKHEMWIDVSLNQFSKPEDLQWMYSIVFTQHCTYSHSPKSYTSPTEAYEAAIEYCLKNII